MLCALWQNPKLPSLASNETYTLVLDLDETLVHYFELDGMGNYDIRPGMHEFLTRMNQLGYEIIIFTAATQDYADWVIDQIDPDHLVHNRLYRQHALPWGPIFVKDLSRLGRDLDRTLIIDNVQENFMLQPHNGIFICTWYDDPHDTALFGLTPLLEELIHTRAKVPDILDKYRDQIPSWAGFDRYSQYGGVEYDYDQAGMPDEAEVAATPVPNRSPETRAPPGSVVQTPSLSYSAYGQAVHATPAGIDSAGGFRSEGGSSPAAAVRQEASPPSSPPAGGVIGSYTSPAMPPQPYQIQSQTNQSTENHSGRSAGTATIVQQTQPHANVGVAGAMAVGTGPAVSSTLVGGYDSYTQYLSQRSTQGGYPPQVAKAGQPQQGRLPTMRQAALAPQLSQTGPQRAVVSASQA